MTFLQLCQAWATEAGVNGSGSGAIPTATANQVGQLLRGVGWVSQAWTDIQSSAINWRFLWTTFTVTLAPAAVPYVAPAGRIYDPVNDWGLTNVSFWARKELRMYPVANGLASEFPVFYLSWDKFYPRFGIGLINASRPQYWTVTPQGKIEFSCPLDQAYQFTNDYYAKPQMLAADTDEPIIDEEHHFAIVYKAVMSHAEFYEAGNQFATAQRKYKALMAPIRRKYLPDITFAQPLA